MGGENIDILGKTVVWLRGKDDEILVRPKPLFVRRE